MRSYLRLLVVLVLASCAEMVEPSEGPEGARKDESFIVAISADFGDVYGATEVYVEGNESVVLEPGAVISCEDSPLVARDAGFELRALSERFFYWEFGSRRRVGNCIIVNLDVVSLDTGLIAYWYADLRDEPCLPMEYFIRVEGVEASVGWVEESWEFDLQLDDFYVQKYARLLELAREKKVVVAGGGKSIVPFELRVEPPEHCGVSRDWVTAGATTMRGELHAFGIEWGESND